MKLLILNACVYCGRKAQGNYSIHRDGAMNGNDGNPQVPLCDACGGHPEPSLRQIWMRISLRDDNGDRWTATPEQCDSDVKVPA